MTVLFLALVAGCDSGAFSAPVFEVVVNPYRLAPLTAVVKATCAGIAPKDVESISITVAGIDEGAGDLTGVVRPGAENYQDNFDMSDMLEGDEIGIPVLGLYPDHDNRVRFEIRTPADNCSGEVVIKTDPIKEIEGESVTVDLLDEGRMEAGWTYLNYRVYDHAGRCRWYGMDILQRLPNGNILKGNDEFNWLGRAVKRRSLPEHLKPHHDAIQLRDGNIVVCVSNAETTLPEDGEEQASTNDYIVEQDAESGEIVNAWDLREFLDVSRATVSRRGSDWVHMNTLGYDERDDSLIISNRFQGLMKLTRGGIRGAEANAGKALKWILSPHLDWGLAGVDGAGPLDPNDFLLTAVDANGTPYPQAVQDNLAAPGETADPFFWSVGQHGIQITARGEERLSFLTFNNQASVIFDGPGTVQNGSTFTAQGDLGNDREGAPYSQIVEYEIDEAEMTVRQVWSFGEGRPELYGGFNSGVTLLPETGNRLLVSNGRDQHDTDNPYNPHVVEITPDGDEVFHLEMINTEVSAYRSGRVHLYPPE